MHMSGYPAGVPMALRLEEPPLVRAAGEGRLEVTPDTAVVSLGFSARTDTAAAAYEQAAAALSQVVRALLELGIPQEQMQSDQIAVRPVYDRERLVGYEGSATLRVTLRDLTAVGAAIDRAVAAGATIVQGVNFELRDPTAYEATALALAAHDARRKAALLARSLGVGLGPVWRVEAEPSPGPIIPAFARAAPMEGIPILPGTLVLSRHVRADFVIWHAFAQ